MAEKRFIWDKNGEDFCKFYIFKCSCCKNDIPENYPHEEINNEYYCGECAFKNGIITDKQYIKNYLHGINLDKLRVCVKNGEIHITTSKFPWERTARDRECKEYANWRLNVFKRDNFTCVNCGKVGGELNAHHIKEYSKYPKLRYKVSNGVTLCVECHRNLHKERRKINGNL